MRSTTSWIVAGWLLAASPCLVAAEPIVQATIMRCDGGPITKTFGKADWLVMACGDGSLMLQPAPVNGASHPFTYRPNEVNPFVEGRFQDERAKAAYKELMKLTTEQYNALVKEVRAGANQGTERK
jgi:hypothetical protein